MGQNTAVTAQHTLGVSVVGEELADAACNSGNHQHELNFGLDIDIAVEPYNINQFLWKK